MKKNLSLAFILNLAFIICSAQNITPNQSTLFCPNTEYTFTATLPKPYASMIGIGGCSITQLPQSSGGTTITFKGKFADVNAKQSFQITYNDNTTYPFDFLNIQSLFYYNSGVTCIQIHPSPASINAPVCQNAAIALSFSPVQWYTEFTQPSTNCFGSITNYEYKLPANWKIGSSTSSGNNWISGGASVSIVPDASTGNGLYVYVRPATCAANLANSYIPVAIPVTRGPGFSISSNTPSFTCGATPTVALTINNNAGIASITDYTWSFGSASNGWQFTSGSAVPATYSTGTTSNLSLKPNCGSVISSIGATVTNTVNGQACTSTIAPYTVAITQPNLYINGASIFCSGSSSYNIGGGLPCNSTVNWSISPTTFVSLSNSSDSSTNLTYITNGATTLTSNITSCGVAQTQSIVVQNGTPAYTQSFTPFSVGAFNGSQTLTDNQTVPPNTPISVAVAVTPGSGYTRQGFLNTEWQSSLVGTTITPNSGNGCGDCINNVGATMQFPCVTGVTTTYIQARVQNGCGWSNWFPQPAFRLQIDPTGTNCGTGGGGSTLYTISPNPAAGMVNISSKMGSSLISSIKTYYSSTGALKQTYTFSPASSSVTISVDRYTNGQYIFQIIGSGGTESQQIVVQN